jgi:glycosyltransferase involved in cell wall biosynthesis
MNTDMSDDRQFLVSAVIPAYNAQQHIQRAVNSVLNQTRPVHEIIVVDDGSTDNTPTLLAEYGDQIINIRQTNAGASIARNTGIERASGNWIAFLDADDQWLPPLVETLVKTLADHPELVWAYGNYWFVSNSGQRKRLAFQPPPPSYNNVIQDYLMVHSRYCIRTSASIINKSVLCDSGLFLPEQKWVQDTDLFLRIAYKHPRIGYVDTPLANYSADTPESLTSRYCFLAEELCSLVERHLILSQEYNRQDELIQAMSEKIPYWIKVAQEHKDFKEAHIMLNRMGHLLPRNKVLKLRCDLYLAFLCAVLNKCKLLQRFKNK